MVPEDKEEEGVKMIRKVIVMEVSINDPSKATICACPECAATFYVHESPAWGKDHCPHCGAELNWIPAGWEDETKSR